MSFQSGRPSGAPFPLPRSHDVTLEDAPLPPIYDARDLIGVDGQAWIILDGARYVLRITRAGKLILTK